jgi:hypothetical protein
MRIAQSAIGLESSYASVRAERTQLDLKVHAAPPPPPPEQPPAAEDTGEVPTGDFKTWLMRLVVELFTGKKIDDVELPECDAEPEAPRAQPQPSVELHYEHVRYEAEKADFRAQGVVTTGDGRQIALDLRIGMQREQYERVTLDVGQPPATDPLVLNFESATTALGGTRMSFDLDLDGEADQVALPSAGSAFLAFDRNHNGKIDDGSELFGPASGNGFAELAALDGDGDGWIDEDDAAFDQLRVWDGTGDPLTLAQAGVGAIHTGSAATPFTLDGGVIQSTGVWLGEDGSAHTVQHVDLNT